MGSFNLGRIKGDKGDRGETGAKGDTGAKGEKGDKGDSGRDGLTPVFTVGKTLTLSPGEEAYVEINTETPSSPVLSFGIPAGQSGKDASGDMLTSVYDTKAVGKDIYEYVQEMTGKCLKFSGGNMEGSLTAAQVDKTHRAVRNISVLTSLPETAAEGDICIIVKDENSKTLGECDEGTVMLMKENGEEIPYLVAGTDYHGKNTVTLIRNHLYTLATCYDYNKRGSYHMSDIDVFLELVFSSYFPESVKKHLIPAELSTGVYRHCFLPTQTDLTSLGYFSEQKKRIAYRNKTAISEGYMTATVNGQNMIVIVTSAGVFSSLSQTEKMMFRPMVVLPADFPVTNIEYNSLPAVKHSDTEEGIYVYLGDKWKECAYL